VLPWWDYRQKKNKNIVTTQFPMMLILSLL